MDKLNIFESSSNMYPLRAILTFRQIHHMTLHVDVLTSFNCDVTIMQLFDGPFDCDVIMKSLPIDVLSGLWRSDNYYISVLHAVI